MKVAYKGTAMSSSKDDPDLKSDPDKVLGAAAVFWFLVAVAGPWLFVTHAVSLPVF